MVKLVYNYKWKLIWYFALIELHKKHIRIIKEDYLLIICLGSLYFYILDYKVYFDNKARDYYEYRLILNHAEKLIILGDSHVASMPEAERDRIIWEY